MFIYAIYWKTEVTLKDKKINLIAYLPSKPGMGGNRKSKTKNIR